MRPFVLTLLIVGVSPVFALAQEIDLMKAIRSQRNREYHKDANREIYRALWNGNGAVISSQSLWADEGFRQELDFTPEQLSQLDFMYSKGGSMGHWYQTKRQTDPVLDQMLAEHEPLNAEIRKDPYGETTPPETVRIYLEGLRTMTAYYFTESQKDVEKLLTPEQMQKVRESELALISETPVLNPSMFECLSLTDAQRDQMVAIKKELEPEFEKIVEELVDIEDRLQDMQFESLVKNGITLDGRGKPITIADGKPLEKAKGEEIMAKFSKEDAPQQLSKRINERASGFMHGFQVKMLDVLTDEQLAKMLRIIDNPAGYVKKVRDKMQKERTEREKQDNNKWQPGINSWRPGDPVPKEYMEQRQQRSRFPRKELPETDI